MTQKDASGSWQVKGLPWEKLQAGEAITEETRQILYGCLCKLKDYEDSGMNPDRLKNWQYELDDVATQVCDELCRHPREITEQEELEGVCENCPINVCVGRILSWKEAQNESNIGDGYARELPDMP